MDIDFNNQLTITLVGVFVGAIIGTGASICTIFLEDQLREESIEAELVIVGVHVKQIEKLNSYPFENLRLNITIPNEVKSKKLILMNFKYVD